MKPTLFLLAAGMGSRYGGLKQLDTLGPQGQSIMDYSIYDAIQAGFGKIVWVIRRDFEQQFREQILAKYEGHVHPFLLKQTHVGKFFRQLICSQYQNQINNRLEKSYGSRITVLHILAKTTSVNKA